MPEKTKNNVMVMSSLIGCIVTLLTCGVLIGNIQSNDRNQSKEITKIVKQVQANAADVSDIKEEQAFQKGVVSTQLQTHGTALVRIEKILDDIVRVD